MRWHTHTDHVQGCVACELAALDAPAYHADELTPPPSDGLIRVDRDELRVAREAAGAAAAAQRLLDLTHLRTCVTHTDQGPAVLWHDVERVMPLPTER